MSCVRKGWIYETFPQSKSLTHKYTEEIYGFISGCLPHPVTSNGGGSLRIHIWRQAILGTCPTASPQEAPSHPDESVVDVDTLRYIDEVFSNPLSRTHSLLKRGPNKLPLLARSMLKAIPWFLTHRKNTVTMYSQRGFLIFNRCCHNSCQIDVHHW